MGDSPRVHLDTRELKALGWQTTTDVREAIVETARWLLDNRWIIGARDGAPAKGC